MVTLKLAGDPRRANSRFASRCNSEYKLLNNASAAALSPLSAPVISDEIVGPKLHLPIGELFRARFSVAHFQRAVKVSCRAYKNLKLTNCRHFIVRR